MAGEGYKVYSCTPSLLESGKNDLPFLLSAAQAKQPYSDPSFMDDAYLYHVPEKGDNFMVGFHPVPYDAGAKGDYSHRAGNFVNHILVGDFSGFYPYELFGDDSVWTAKACGEAHYYENAPVSLPPRADIGCPAGQFGLDEIRAFIADGRGEALMRAVSFLITQFRLPPEERKYLVIRDETSGKIEMWIAAIERAFSPRIAASVPFATRMDKFAAANRYAVNQAGAYLEQINLQDRRQKLRYRAMIVGVDERDSANAAAARPPANPPFVLLDGNEKQALFEADISNRYFRFITSFTDTHQSFCREFLQAFNISEPNPDIFELLDVYLALGGPSLPNAEYMGTIAAIMGKHTITDPGMLRGVYDRVTAALPFSLPEDPRSAVQIMKWLQAFSWVVGDPGSGPRLTDIICEAFTDLVYKKRDAGGALEFWHNIKNSEFAEGVARHFADPATRRNNQAYLHQFGPADVIAFTRIYIDCAAYPGLVEEGDLLKILKGSLEYCFTRNDGGSARMILSYLSQNTRADINDTLLALAVSAGGAYADHYAKLLTEYDRRILSSDTAVSAFVKKLHTEGLGHLAIPVLELRIGTLSKAADVDRFIKSMEKAPALFAGSPAETTEARVYLRRLAEEAKEAILAEKQAARMARRKNADK